MLKSLEETKYLLQEIKSEGEKDQVGRWHRLKYEILAKYNLDTATTLKYVTAPLVE